MTTSKHYNGKNDKSILNIRLYSHFLHIFSKVKSFNDKTPMFLKTPIEISALRNCCSQRNGFSCKNMIIREGSSQDTSYIRSFFCG